MLGSSTLVMMMASKYMYLAYNNETVMPGMKCTPEKLPTSGKHTCNLEIIFYYFPKI